MQEWEVISVTILRYRDMKISDLASVLNIGEHILRDTHNNNGLILSDQADNLAQFF